MTTTDEPREPAPAALEKLSFFELNPKKIGRTRLIRTLAFALCIVCFSIAPLWRLFWYLPVYSAKCFFPTLDTRNCPRAAWHWVDGKEIRLYAGPGVNPRQADIIAEGVRAMVAEVGLDFTVTVIPLPADVRAAYEASLVPFTIQGRRVQAVNFSKLERRLIALRKGDPHADMIISKAPLAGRMTWWAHGMATFTSGVGIFIDDNVNFHLGKHETGHLLGYLFHDDLPLYVFGYPWEGIPGRRDTLMVLQGNSNVLSPRTRDALHYFWRGLEDRSGKKFLKEAVTRGAPRQSAFVIRHAAGAACLTTNSVLYTGRFLHLNLQVHDLRCRLIEDVERAFVGEAEMLVGKGEVLAFMPAHDGHVADGGDGADKAHHQLAARADGYLRRLLPEGNPAVRHVRAVGAADSEAHFIEEHFLPTRFIDLQPVVGEGIRIEDERAQRIGIIEEDAFVILI